MVIKDFLSNLSLMRTFSTPLYQQDIEKVLKTEVIMYADLSLFSTPTQGP